MDILISVVVPVYNGEKYLSECIESILQQSHKNLELITVVDGNSSDASLDILNDYAEKDERVIVCNDSTKGVSENRYLGFSKAKGEYICFVDNDDVLNKYALEVLLYNCKKHDSEFAVGKHMVFKGDVVENDDINKENSYLLEGFEKRILECHLPLWGKLYRRCLLQKIDFKHNRECFPCLFFEDTFLTPLLFNIAPKVVGVEGYVYYQRYNETSLSRNSELQAYHLEIYKVKKNHLGLFKEHSPNFMYKEVLREYANCLIKAYTGINAKDSFLKEEKVPLFHEIIKEYDEIYSVLMKEAVINMQMRISFIVFRLSPKLWQVCFGAYYRKHYWNFSKID